MQAISVHPKIEDWLAEFDSQKTKWEYSRRLNLFLTDNNLAVENLEAMNPDDIKHIILKWRSELIAKGIPQNSVLSDINGVRSFLSQIHKSVKFRKGALGKVQADVDSHVFTNGDLKTLFEIGDTTEKAIITTACSLGWEISGFLDLEREKTKRLLEHAKQNNEEFIFFEDIREKTQEARLAVFNPLAIQWLAKYLETTEEQWQKNKVEFPIKLANETDPTKKKFWQDKIENLPMLFDYTPDGINKMLQALADKSGLKTTGNIRFHNIRKWLMSRLSRCGFGEFQIKYILGKAIPVSDRTYLQTLKSEVEEKYPKVYNDYLNISPIIGMTDAKKQVENISKEFQNTKTQLTELIVSQAKKIETQDCKLTELKDYLTGIDHAVLELQHKHPDITLEDLNKIKESTNRAIEGLSNKLSLVIDFLAQKYPELKQQ